MELFSLEYSLLAMQGALLGVVSPDLRAVMVDLCKEQSVLYMRFYYNGAVSEKQIDLWQSAITEACPTLHLGETLDDEVKRLDYPQPIPLRGRFAYRRREPFLPQALNQVIQPTFSERELVDFKQKIGFFVSPVDGEKEATAWGVTHYAKEGCHIIPARPPNHEDKVEVTPFAYGMLAMQRALLGVVTPELRAVVVDVNQRDQVCYVRFYYDSTPATVVFDDWEGAISELCADLGPEYSLDVKMESWPYPKKIPFRGRYAYRREEG